MIVLCVVAVGIGIIVYQVWQSSKGLVLQYNELKGQGLSVSKIQAVVASSPLAKSGEGGETKEKSVIA
ncbi:unnamed protein product, partial [Mesorhabditis spiculigera]